MKSAIGKYWSNTYSDMEWSAMKPIFIVGWMLMLAFILSSLTHIENPEGICTFIDCNIISGPVAKILIGAITISLAFLYIFERYMILALTGLSIISILVISAGESNGIPARSELLSAILIAQLIAYIKFKITKNQDALQQDRVRYSVQIIGAAYMLSAFTKVRVSGIDWIFQGKQLAVNAKITVLRLYADRGWESVSDYAESVNEFFFSHPNIVAAILLISLLIEAAGFICFFGKKATLAYGFILLLFHGAIFATMFVYVPPILLVVFVFVLNGPGGIVHLLQRLKST